MNNEQHKKALENVAEVNDSVGGGEYRECPICKAKVPTFRPFGINPRPNAQCPKCGSLERHRALWFLLEKLDWHKSGMKVLHFAPEGVFYNLFSSFKDIDYWPVDLNPNMRGVRKAVDITNITFDDDSFDLIMATRVLEHIPDDKKAMSELYRVLKPKTGIAFLNVPMTGSPQTLEKPEYNTPELRLKYYGQADHVRYYGLDYPQRLRDAGFTVQEFKVNNINEEDLKRYCINKREKIYWCTKG